jgi:hypothetical protein
MDTLLLKSDINVIGFPVKTFPNGISEAFDLLVAKIPEGLGRSYFGISMTVDEEMSYIAAVEENDQNEGQKLNLGRYTISKGEYNIVTVTKWRDKLDSIKDIFHEMMKEKSADLSQPCIEWYKNNDVMVCMVKRIFGV